MSEAETAGIYKHGKYCMYVCVYIYIGVLFGAFTVFMVFIVWFAYRLVLATHARIPTSSATSYERSGHPLIV